MPILETRSEVKVTVIQGWYATLSHSKMHANTKFGIPTSNDIRNMLPTQLFYLLGQRSRSQGPANATGHCHAKMHPHTKFGIPTSKNTGDMHRTGSGTDRRIEGRMDGQCYYYMPPKVPLGA